MSEIKYEPLPEGVHESHIMMPTPIGTYECQFCWGCTCHRRYLLTDDCGENPIRRGPFYSKVNNEMQKRKEK